MIDLDSYIILLPYYTLYRTWYSPAPLWYWRVNTYMLWNSCYSWWQLVQWLLIQFSTEIVKYTYMFVQIYLIKTYMSDPITCLRNDGDSWPEILQTNAGNVNAINNNGPTHSFNNTKQCQSKGCLSSPSPTHNTNLRVRYMKASQVTKWVRKEQTIQNSCY